MGPEHWDSDSLEWTKVPLVGIGREKDRVTTKVARIDV